MHAARTDSATELDDADVGRAVAAVARDMRHALNPVLHSVGDVRDDLREKG